MPISPSPGRGVSTVGIDKTSGWGSNDAAGNPIVGHEADQGINHLMGLSEAGLDTGSAPYARPLAQTGMTGTAVVLNWQSIPACPAGSVKYRLAGSSGAYTTVAEAAGTKSSHSIPLSGLTAAKTYEYIVTQPSWIVGGVPIEFSGRVHTLGGVGFAEEPQGMSSPLDGGAGTAGTGTAPTTPAPGLVISAIQAQATDATTVQVTWRTDVYADGQVDWEGGGSSGSVVEDGNKRMNHLVTLVGLQPGVAYVLAVSSEDAAGAEAAEEVGVSTPTA